MVNYYYAQDEKFENGIHYLKVPIIVTPETVEVNHQRIFMVQIGYRQFPCIYDWIPASYYDMHKRDLEQQAKEDERSRRCLIPDPKKTGGRIRCPECNRCISCHYARKLDFDNGHDASLNALMEDGFDAETGVECESDYDAASSSATPEDILISEDEKKHLDETLDILVSLLAERKPKYGAIFSELRKCETNASEIARRCGLKSNRTAEDVRKVQSMAKELYKKMR